MSQTVFLRKFAFVRRSKFCFTSASMCIFSSFLFKTLIHLITSSFCFFIRVISPFANFHFLEITLSSFCFLTFSATITYLFANLQLLRGSLGRSYSIDVVTFFDRTLIMRKNKVDAPDLLKIDALWVFVEKLAKKQITYTFLLEQVQFTISKMHNL